MFPGTGTGTGTGTGIGGSGIGIGNPMIWAEAGAADTMAEPKTMAISRERLILRMAFTLLMFTGPFL
jgi:hypothetical protein